VKGGGEGIPRRLFYQYSLIDYLGVHLLALFFEGERGFKPATSAM
jgi:hypothetical protein